MSKTRAECLAILGLPLTATDDEIKKAYRQKALELHPDKNHHDPNATERFQSLQEAYQTLADTNEDLEYVTLEEIILTMFLDRLWFRPRFVYDDGIRYNGHSRHYHGQSSSPTSHRHYDDNEFPLKQRKFQTGSKTTGTANTRSPATELEESENGEEWLEGLIPNATNKQYGTKQKQTSKKKKGKHRKRRATRWKNLRPPCRTGQELVSETEDVSETSEEENCDDECETKYPVTSKELQDKRNNKETFTPDADHTTYDKSMFNKKVNGFKSQETKYNTNKPLRMNYHTASNCEKTSPELEDNTMNPKITNHKMSTAISSNDSTTLEAESTSKAKRKNQAAMTSSPKIKAKDPVQTKYLEDKSQEKEIYHDWPSCTKRPLNKRPPNDNKRKNKAQPSFGKLISEQVSPPIRQIHKSNAPLGNAKVLPLREGFAIKNETNVLCKNVRTKTKTEPHSVDKTDFAGQNIQEHSLTKTACNANDQRYISSDGKSETIKASCPHTGGMTKSHEVNACSGQNNPPNNATNKTFPRIHEVWGQNESKTVSKHEFLVKKEYDQFVDRHVDHMSVERHMRLISRARGNWTSWT